MKSSVLCSAAIVASRLISASRRLTAQAVDLALDVLGLGLRSLQRQLGAPFGVADDTRRLLLGVLAHVVGDLLRSHQRRLQTAFELAELLERRLEPDDLHPQPLVLAQRVVESFGRFLQERRDVGPCRSRAVAVGETRLPHVERA